MQKTSYFIKLRAIAITYMVVAVLAAVVRVEAKTVKNKNTKTRSTTLTVDTKHILSKTSDISFGCVDIDWWPSTKCDYGTCAWGDSSILNLNLENKKLNNAINELSPIFLRVGGSLADSVHYEEASEEEDQNQNQSQNQKKKQEGEDTDDKDPHADGTTSSSTDTACKPFSSPTNDTRLGYEIGTGCLTMKRWEEINHFCQARKNCHLVFDINALIGRMQEICPPNTNCHVQDASIKHPCCTTWTGNWDHKNAEHLLRYTYKHFKSNVYAFEFGNELVGSKGIEATLSVEQYVHDFCNLYSLINKIWSEDKDEGARIPKLITPDTAFEEKWFGEFLHLTNEKKCYPDIMTWHQYLLGAGVDPKVSERAMSPSILNQQILNGHLVNHTIMSNARINRHNHHDNTTAISSQIDNIPEIWVGEAGGAYNSGRHLVTDAFMSSFWFLDGFGILSEYNHQTFCRQTLIGGNYGLLNTTTFEPNPDYYALLLWQRLMGRIVFHVDIINNDDHFDDFHTNTYEKENARLDVNVIESESLFKSRKQKKSLPSYLRAYAHCTNKTPNTDVITENRKNNKANNSNNFDSDDNINGSSLTILLLNLSNDTEYVVNIQDYMNQERYEYVMHSTALDSQSVFLNGKILKTNFKDEIPQMDGQLVEPIPSKERRNRDNELNNYDKNDDNSDRTIDNLIHVKPLTYGFYTFPRANLKHCER